jgi:probable rRNA maturation factor
MSPVNIENISSDSGVRMISLKNLARGILKDFGEKGEVNIVLISDDYMRRLNQRFARRKGSTDVLSFSFREDKAPEGNKEFLGEVYVSVDKARRQAQRYKVSLRQELERLVVHGMLHLLGYDHKLSRDKQRMREKEEEYTSSKRRRK